MGTWFMKYNMINSDQLKLNRERVKISVYIMGYYCLDLHDADREGADY